MTNYAPKMGVAMVTWLTNSRRWVIALYHICCRRLSVCLSMLQADCIWKLQNAGSRKQCHKLIQTMSMDF